jgi:hypothetical protein
METRRLVAAFEQSIAILNEEWASRISLLELMRKSGDKSQHSKFLLHGDKSPIDRRQIAQGNYLVRLRVRLSPRLEAPELRFHQESRRGAPSAHPTSS